MDLIPSLKLWFGSFYWVGAFGALEAGWVESQEKCSPDELAGGKIHWLAVACWPRNNMIRCQTVDRRSICFPICTQLAILRVWFMYWTINVYVSKAKSSWFCYFFLRWFGHFCCILGGQLGNGKTMVIAFAIEHELSTGSGISMSSSETHTFAWLARNARKLITPR